MKNKLIVFLIFVISLVLIGCNTNTVEDENMTSEKVDIITEDNLISYQVTHKDMDYLYDSVFIQNDYVYGLNHSNPDTILIECINNTNDNQSVKITDAQEIYIIWNNEGNIYAFGMDNNDITSVWLISPDYSYEKVKEINDITLGLYPTFYGYYSDVSSYNYLWFKSSVLCSEVYEDGEDDAYTLVDRVLIFDKDMIYLGYDEVPDSYDNHLFGIVYDNDQNLLFLAKDEVGCYKRRITIDSNATESKERLKITLNMYDMIQPMLCKDEGVIYIQNGDIHMLNYNAGTDSNIYHLSNAGIYENDIVSWNNCDDGIVILDNSDNSKKTEITILKEVEGEQESLSEDNVVTIAIMNSQQSINEAVTAYNRSQNDIQVKTVVYAPDWDMEKGLQNLQLDIVQGKAPDLISTNSLDYETLINVGVFDDLYEYMDNDEEFGRDDIVPSVMKSYETGDKLYVMGPSFTIFTMWGGRSVINGQKCLGINEINNLLESYGGDINSIYGLSTADETTLRSLMAMEMDDYIDWDNGTCDFNSDGFKDILKLAKEYEGIGIDKSLYDSLSNKEILMTYGMVSAVQGYSLECKLYGEPIDYVGYPTSNGYGSAMQMYSPIAINAASDKKEEAWDFLKFYIKHDYAEVYDFSVCSARLEEQFEEAMEEKYVEDESGDLVKTPIASYYDVGYSTEIYYVTKEDVEAVKDLINNTTKKREYVLEIQKIIEEEAGAYMVGQKSADEVADIIQSRVEIYLQERNDKK